MKVKTDKEAVPKLCERQLNYTGAKTCFLNLGKRDETNVLPKRKQREKASLLTSGYFEEQAGCNFNLLVLFLFKDVTSVRCRCKRPTKYNDQGDDKY